MFLSPLLWNKVPFSQDHMSEVWFHKYLGWFSSQELFWVTASPSYHPFLQVLWHTLENSLLTLHISIWRRQKQGDNCVISDFLKSLEQNEVQREHLDKKGSIWEWSRGLICGFVPRYYFPSSTPKIPLLAFWCIVNLCCFRGWGSDLTVFHFFLVSFSIVPKSWAN